MHDRRVEQRLMCADLVDVAWKDTTGRRKKTVANLEDISFTGACLQLDVAIPLGTSVLIGHPNGSLPGSVRYCVYREIGYFIGIEFDPGIRWDQKQFKPQYLFDPRRLAKSERVLKDMPPPTESVH